MKINTDEWKEFRVGDLFTVNLSKGDLKINDIDAGSVPLISSGDTNNGNVGRISAFGDSVAEIFDKGQLTIDMFGKVYYQPEKFYAVSHGRVNILTPNFELTENIGLFLSTVIEAERYKFSYGRAVYSKVAENITIKLPATPSGEPDWQFMENYIKSLHYKPLTTANKKGKTPELKTDEWGEFRITDWFDVCPGKYHPADEYDEGKIPYYSASASNNGIKEYINIEPEFKGECIVTGKIGSTAFYAPTDFCATSDVNILIPKFPINENIGIFIASIINFSENYKWAYGRQCRVGNTKNIMIKLPITPTGEPDWQFMESYIKSLPYGDRL